MTEIKKHNGDSIALNRRARFDYQIVQTLEAGLVLTGTEVKSLRLGQANIAGAHASADGDEIFLHGLHIAEYEQAGRHLQHRPLQSRKLLLSRREINKIIGAISKQGMTLVPIKLYFNKRGRAKLELGLAKGKKQHEKRDTIKQRDWDRQKQRIIKDNG